MIRRSLALVFALVTVTALAFVVWPTPDAPKQPTRQTKITDPRILSACEGLTEPDMSACLTLAAKPPVDTPMTGTPAGYLLVKECRDQYMGGELSDCLTQE